MVIRRRDTKTGQPVRQGLGHVGVSTDDLQALLDLLRSRADVVGDVIVEFDEGDFTEGKDLKELGQASLRDLRVKAGDLVVHLTDSRAEAIGPAALVEFVSNAWARSRQTTEYPSTRKRSQRYSYRVPTIGMIVFAIGVMIYAPVVSPVKNSVRLILSDLGIGACIAFLAFLIYWTNKRAYEQATWAVIRPLTAHEIRDVESKRTVVPLWSLVATGLGLVISTTFLILNYLRH